MKKTKRTITLTESELKNMIVSALNECINEQQENIDENFIEFAKAFGGAAKNSLNKAASFAGNKMNKLGNNLMDKGRQFSNGIKKAGNVINNEFNNMKLAGEKASSQGDSQRIANLLIKWFKDGVFGDSRQAKAYISGLINAINRKYSAKYGEESNVQKNW